ncbi:hypothetical protein S83_023342, partial [Arachis hypogaea]
FLVLLVVNAIRKFQALILLYLLNLLRFNLLVVLPLHNFDACFMDLQMPEMDGFEVTRKIRILENDVNEKIACGEASAEMFGDIFYWHIPILAMTADVTQASNEECKKCGMAQYPANLFSAEGSFSAYSKKLASTIRWTVNDQMLNGWPLGLGFLNIKLRVTEAPAAAPVEPFSSKQIPSTSFSSFSSSNLDTECIPWASYRNKRRGERMIVLAKHVE